MIINKIISDTGWKPASKMILENNALAIIREDNNVLAIAGPGAGKTELLAQKACYLLQTNKCINPRKILAISFKKDAAENLKERIEKRCDAEFHGRFISLTYDSFAKGLLDQFRNGLPSDYRPEKNYCINEDKYIQLAFQQVGFKNYNNYSLSRLKSYFYKQLAAVKIPNTLNSINEKVFSLLIKGSADIQSCLTFQMISILAEYIIRTNLYLKKSLLTTYSYVFLDEFQDTTNIQYELVKTCFMNTNTKITAVGDNKQRVMLWAGAMKTAFNKYCSDFTAKSEILTMNHRSAPKLVKLQMMMYASLQDTQCEICCSDKWNNEEGEINLFKFDSFDKEVSIISEEINKLYKKGIKLKDICILTKQLPIEYTISLINKLNSLNIKARVDDKYQDLLKEPITILIINSIYLIIKKKKTSSWEIITNYFKNAYSEQIHNNYDYLLDKQIELDSLFKHSKNYLLKCKTNLIFEKIVNRLLKYYNLDIIKSIYPAYSQDSYFDYSKKTLIELLWENYVQANFNWEVTLENFEGLNSIPIMTIHKSKGLEYDSVYFIGLEDSAFWNFRNQPHEDRCAFFVALSRAKRHISFTFCKNRKTRYNNIQTHNEINEFYNLLETSGIVNVKQY